MLVVKVAVTDDQDMHRSMLKMSLANLARSTATWDFQIVGEAANGKDLCSKLPGLAADLFSLDIRMPEQDGLTTLFLLRKRHHITAPILMVSSEEEGNVARFVGASGGSKDARSLPFEKKLELMARIEDRVLKGAVEPGKINDLLSGCEQLQLDPRRYAQHLGANGFLHKPYHPDQVAAIVPAVINGKSFAA